MSASRLAVALTAGFFASTASVWPGPSATSPRPHVAHGKAAQGIAAEASSLSLSKGKTAQDEAAKVWPPAAVKPAPGAVDIAARMELTATGAHRLVLEKTGTFVHLAYREVSAGGPDWAAIELRAGERAPAADVAVWEATDPTTLVTRRGLVSFALAAGTRPEVTAAEPPRPGPRDISAVRVCQAHHDGESGFAVVCRLTAEVAGVRAARPAAARPLAGAWVWEPPRAPFAKKARFVRIDLPLSPGGAEVGALTFVHGARGVVVRADATWPSREEAPALLFTETSRTQPTSPSFSWR